MICETVKDIYFKEKLFCNPRMFFYVSFIYIYCFQGGSSGDCRVQCRGYSCCWAGNVNLFNKVYIVTHLFAFYYFIRHYYFSCFCKFACVFFTTETCCDKIYCQLSVKLFKTSIFNRSFSVTQEFSILYPTSISLFFRG